MFVVFADLSIYVCIYCEHLYRQIHYHMHVCYSVKIKSVKTFLTKAFIPAIRYYKAFSICPIVEIVIKMVW